jgi:DNA-binding CsgD family transcriptional regulator
MGLTGASMSRERIALDLHVASLDGTPLEPALHAIAGALGAQMFLLHRADRQSVPISNSAQVASLGIPHSAIEQYMQGWIVHDPWLQASRGLPAGVVNLSRLVPPETMRRSLFWNDFLRTEVPTFHGLSLLMDDQTGLTGFFTFWRPPTHEAFDAREEDLLGWFGPHIERAFRAEARRAGPAHDGGALDALTHGVATLARDGSLQNANAALQRIVSAEDGIALDRFGLRLTQRRDQHRLNRAIEAALAASRRGSALEDSTLCLAHRSSGAPPYLIEVLPIPAAGGARRGGAVVLVMDGGARRTPTPELLMQLHGLTPSEAALAAALTTGDRLEDYAQRRRITLPTARTHLARVFAKVGVSRQGELIALLSRYLT